MPDKDRELLDKILSAARSAQAVKLKTELAKEEADKVKEEKIKQIPLTYPVTNESDTNPPRQA